MHAREKALQTREVTCVIGRAHTRASLKVRCGGSYVRDLLYKDPSRVGLGVLPNDLVLTNHSCRDHDPNKVTFEGRRLYRVNLGARRSILTPP